MQHFWIAMGFYNMQKGDAPLFKRLADKPTTPKKRMRVGSDQAKSH